MEKELHEHPLYRRFAGLYGAARMSVETTILRFRHLLEEEHTGLPGPGRHQHVLAQQSLMLRTGTIVDVTIISAPSSTKDQEGERPPRCTRPRKEPVALRYEGAH